MRARAGRRANLDARSAREEPLLPDPTTEDMSDSIDVILAQTAPRLRATRDNAGDLLAAAEAARGAGPSLLVAPELALSGYDLRDAAAEAALTPEHVAALLAPAGAAIAGFPERANDGALYNSAAHVDGGRVVAVHRKVYLPTYGMFDEARVFAPGDDVAAHDWSGWRIGMLVCEDYWHPGLVYALAAQRIELLVVLAAAPGRGVLEAEDGARFASWQTWRRMAEVYARVLGIYVALVNRTGVEDGVTFAGGSFVMSPDGRMVASAPEGTPGTTVARLERAELTRARTPAWHGRDDRPLVVARALMRAEGIG